MEMWKGERVVQSSFVFFLSLVRFELKRGTDLVGGECARVICIGNLWKWLVPREFSYAIR